MNKLVEWFQVHRQAHELRRKHIELLRDMTGTANFESNLYVVRFTQEAFKRYRKQLGELDA